MDFPDNGPYCKSRQISKIFKHVQRNFVPAQNVFPCFVLHRLHSQDWLLTTHRTSTDSATRNESTTAKNFFSFFLYLPFCLLKGFLILLNQNRNQGIFPSISVCCLKILSSLWHPCPGTYQNSHLHTSKRWPAEYSL